MAPSVPRRYPVAVSAILGSDDDAFRPVLEGDLSYRYAGRRGPKALTLGSYSSLDMPSTRSTRFLQTLGIMVLVLGTVVALAAVSALGVSAEPGPGVAPTTVATGNLTISGHASPDDPKATATHYVTVTVPEKSDEETLHRLRLDYTHTGVDLTDGLSHYRATLYRNPDTENESEAPLSNTSLSATNRTVTYQFSDEPTLQAGDELWVAISGPENPAEPGPAAVGVTLNPQQDGPTGSVTLQIPVPAPSISPQGVVGSTTRVGIHDPDGARGFIVAFDEEGSVIGTMALDPDSNRHMDIGIGTFVNDTAERNGMTVRLAAYEDSDRSGTFDRPVDDQFVRDGEPVEATIENAVFEGGTTTTTTSSTSTDETSTTGEDSGMSPTQDTATTTTVPGLSWTAVILALFGTGLYRRIR